MPVYEYHCEACLKTFEMLRKFSDAPLTDCEFCGGKNVLKKLMSLSSFALKGTGWYSTDYKKATPAAAASPSPEPSVKPGEVVASPSSASPASPAPSNSAGTPASTLVTKPAVSAP